ALPPELQDAANVRRVDSALQYVPLALYPGDSLLADGYWLRLDSIPIGSRHPGYSQGEEDLALSANLSVWKSPGSDSTRSFPASADSIVHQLHPTMILRKGLVYGMTDQVNAFNLRVRLRGEGIDTLLPDDSALDYAPLTLKQAETVDW